MAFTHQMINGQVLPREEALIPLTDIGLLRSYGIFDFFRILEGVPVFVEDHLNRMFRSAAMMELPIRWSKAEVRDMIYRLVEVNGAEQAGCRAVLTGGFSDDGYTPSSPNLYLLLHELPVYDQADWQKGCKLITANYVRDIPTVKTCIYVQSILMHKTMKAEGAVEILYHWKGSITECSRSNVFFVTPEGVLVTPSEGMLHGITRKQVLEQAHQDGITIDLREIHLEELPWVSEAFITSSTRGVLPIVQIGETRIGDGKPGPVTMRLHKGYLDRVKAAIASEHASKVSQDLA